MDQQKPGVSVADRIGSHGLRIFGLPVTGRKDDQPRLEQEVRDVRE